MTSIKRARELAGIEGHDLAEWAQPELSEAKKFTLVDPKAPMGTVKDQISNLAKGLEERGLPYPRGVKKLAKAEDWDKVLKLMKNNKHVYSASRSTRAHTGRTLYKTFTVFAGDRVAWQFPDAPSYGGPPVFDAYEVVSFRPAKKTAQIRPAEKSGGGWDVPVAQLRPRDQIGRPVRTVGRHSGYYR